jgi:hypothetical protein
MKMVTFHQVVPGGQRPRLTAFNEEDIVRVEELELGTALHQGDRGPVMVQEKMKEVMETLGQKMPEEPEEPGTKPQPPHPGHPEPEHPEHKEPEHKPEPASSYQRGRGSR